jgi:hypothetical protein
MWNIIHSRFRSRPVAQSITILQNTTHSIYSRPLFGAVGLCPLSDSLRPDLHITAHDGLSALVDKSPTGTLSVRSKYTNKYWNTVQIWCLTRKEAVKHQVPLAALESSKTQSSINATQSVYSKPSGGKDVDNQNLPKIHEGFLGRSGLLAPRSGVSCDRPSEATVQPPLQSMFFLLILFFPGLILLYPPVFITVAIMFAIAALADAIGPELTGIILAIIIICIIIIFRRNRF